MVIEASYFDSTCKLLQHSTIMPVSKVDSKCFNLTKKVDTFLSLGNVGKNDLTPPDFWKELAQSEETVSRLAIPIVM